MRLFRRINRRLKYVFHCFFVDIRNFPMRFVVIDFLFNMFSLNGKTDGLSFRIRKKRDNYIINFLEKNNSNTIEKYVNKKRKNDEKTERIIWVCWLQGEKEAPLLVKKCIASIRNNNPKCKTIVIDNLNYRKYVKLKPYIIEKFNNKQITFAHFSDILRINLINQNGGLWIDATVFCSKEIPESVFEQPFFTCKSPKRESIYISQYQWTGFIIGGARNSIYFSLMAEMLDNYWEKYNTIIEYLLIDYMTFLTNKKIKEIHCLFENNPINNLDRDELQNNFNEPYSKELFDSITKSETYFFKTSWRIKFNEKTDDGKETLYSFFLRG